MDEALSSPINSDHDLRNVDADRRCPMGYEFRNGQPARRYGDCGNYHSGQCPCDILRRMGVQDISGD